MRLAVSLKTHVANYIALKRGLGYKFDTQAQVLERFERFLTTRAHAGPVTQDTILGFVSASDRAGPGWRAHQYQFAKDFADYLATFTPDAPPIPRGALRSSARPAPYILTDSEVTTLLDQARRHRSRNHGTFCGLTYFTMFGLGASTGMRVGEVARLQRGDVQLDRCQVRILGTKFGKSRLVVIHPTTVEALRRYVAARDSTMSHARTDAFFVNLKLRQFDEDNVSLAFSKVRTLAGLDGRATFHSLRHTFAVKTLLRWYREGKDVQALLPALATYMGHVHYTSTAYYLTATAELLEFASHRVTRYLEGA
jgi:integrase